MKPLYDQGPGKIATVLIRLGLVATVGFFVIGIIVAIVQGRDRDRSVSLAQSTSNRRESVSGIVSGFSPTCGSIVGQTREDLNNVRQFCKNITDGSVEGVVGAESLLVIKVDREMAYVMQARAMETEQMILAWMRGWKTLTDRRVVTVTVEWGDVEIAKGQTTLRDDRVTIRGE